MGSRPSERYSNSRLTDRVNVTPHEPQHTSTELAGRTATAVATPCGGARPEGLFQVQSRRCPSRSQANHVDDPGCDRRPNGAVASQARAPRHRLRGGSGRCGARPRSSGASCKTGEGSRPRDDHRGAIATSQRALSLCKPLLLFGSVMRTIERVSVSAFVDPDDHRAARRAGPSGGPLHVVRASYRYP